MEWAIGHIGARNERPEGSIRGAAAGGTTGIFPMIPQRLRNQLESFLRRRNWRNCNNFLS